MSANIYYDPDKFGLTPITEVEWSDGCYEFDKTVFWREKSTGRLLMANDSGCSCPTPFEDIGVADLTPWTTPQLAATYLQERLAKEQESPVFGNAHMETEVANAIAKLVA